MASTHPSLLHAPLPEPPHAASPLSAADISKSNHAAVSNDRFDASQYSFFGGVEAEDELGGLDEEDSAEGGLGGLEDDDGGLYGDDLGGLSSLQYDVDDALIGDEDGEHLNSLPFDGEAAVHAEGSERRRDGLALLQHVDGGKGRESELPYPEDSSLDGITAALRGVQLSSSRHPPSHAESFATHIPSGAAWQSHERAPQAGLPALSHPSSDTNTRGAAGLGLFSMLPPPPSLPLNSSASSPFLHAQPSSSAPPSAPSPLSHPQHPSQAIKAPPAASSSTALSTSPSSFLPYPQSSVTPLASAPSAVPSRPSNFSPFPPPPHAPGGPPPPHWPPAPPTAEFMQPLPFPPPHMQHLRPIPAAAGTFPQLRPGEPLAPQGSRPGHPQAWSMPGAVSMSPTPPPPQIFQQQQQQHGRPYPPGAAAGQSGMPGASGMNFHHPHGQPQRPGMGGMGGMMGRGPAGMGGMRSRYMSQDEIDNILRMQWAATHGSDPYSEDYYHQAMQAKSASAQGYRRFFAPGSLPPQQLQLPHQRHAAGGGAAGQGSTTQQTVFIPVEGLGRLPVSSVRRPRPLLDVEGLLREEGEKEENVPPRPLDQEPMMQVRKNIEDAMCILLDVDDIDRHLSVGQSFSPDALNQLRRRRHLLLEALATYLHLSDPLNSANPNVANAHDFSHAVSPADDLFFLRLVSIPKGRKLLARYLALLPPGSDLQRLVVLAVFRHLRFLFGSSVSIVGSADPVAASANAAAAAKSSASGALAVAVSAAAQQLGLPAATACLAATAVAPEQPPLRSLGSPGDSAALVLRALLDGATSTRSDPSIAPQQRAAWQAVFDLFFERLSKTLCFDSILASLPLPPPAAAAVSKEMPLELLRAALPHTSQKQRDQVGALLQGLLRSSG